MKLKMFKKLTPAVARLALKGKKIAPDAAIVGGLALVIAGGIWMGRRVHKMSEQLDNAYENVEAAKAENDLKMVASARKTYVVEWFKIVGKPLALVVVGSGMVLGGHRALRLRNIGLATALGSESEKLRNIMGRVDKEHGEGTAREWINDVFEEEVEYTDEKGKKKKKKEKVMRADKPSGFATFFDSTSPKWSKDPSLNKMAINAAEKYINKELETGRFVSGYEFFTELAIKPELVFSPDKVTALKQNGWMKVNKDDPIYISYNVFTVNKVLNERFIQGSEPVCIIEPLGMTYIYNYIPVKEVV